MQKFTIFTIILTVSVVTVAADLAVRKYFGDEGLQTSTLSAEQESEPAESQNPQQASQEPEQQFEPQDSQLQDTQDAQSQNQFFDETQAAPVVVSNISQSLIAQAGFSGTLSEEFFNGKVFQLLDITKTPVDGISFYEITQEDAPVASIAEITLRDEIRALQLYILLQNKTKPYIDLSLNETNAYGERSFYINHARKADEAFLVVKIGNRLYAFAYLKNYHLYIKSIINLLFN